MICNTVTVSALVPPCKYLQISPAVIPVTINILGIRKYKNDNNGSRSLIKTATAKRIYTLFGKIAGNRHSESGTCIFPHQNQHFLLTVFDYNMYFSFVYPNVKNRTKKFIRNYFPEFILFMHILSLVCLYFK